MPTWKRSLVQYRETWIGSNAKRLRIFVKCCLRMQRPIKNGARRCVSFERAECLSRLSWTYVLTYSLSTLFSSSIEPGLVARGKGQCRADTRVESVREISGNETAILKVASHITRNQAVNQKKKKKSTPLKGVK